eukprot:sb/3478006/
MTLLAPCVSTLGCHSFTSVERPRVNHIASTQVVGIVRFGFSNVTPEIEKDYYILTLCSHPGTKAGPCTMEGREVWDCFLCLVLIAGLLSAAFSFFLLPWWREKL